MIRSGAVLFFASLLPSCDLVSDAVNDDLLVCADVCTQVDTCAATPPSPSFGALGEVSSGEDGIDCAVSCGSEDRALKGYADCQIDCLVNAECGEIADCWKPKSDLYASYCLNGRDIPEVAPGADDPQPGNGTTTGNQQADELVDDPAVAIAIDESEDDGFVVNYGDQPPELVGRFKVDGTIDESSNARPVGSRIDTTICFWDYTETAGGVKVSYCEDGVPGEDRAAPLTGTNDAFTAYFEYPGQATVMFSGSMNPDGTLSKVEALVVYTYATDVWELSHTDWEPLGDCSFCN